MKNNHEKNLALGAAINHALVNYPKRGLHDLTLAIKAELKARGYRIVKIPARTAKGEK